MLLFALVIGRSTCYKYGRKGQRLFSLLRPGDLNTQNSTFTRSAPGKLTMKHLKQVLVGLSQSSLMSLELELTHHASSHLPAKPHRTSSDNRNGKQVVQNTAFSIHYSGAAPTATSHACKKWISCKLAALFSIQWWTG